MYDLQGLGLNWYIGAKILYSKFFIKTKQNDRNKGRIVRQNEEVTCTASKSVNSNCPNKWQHELIIKQEIIKVGKSPNFYKLNTFV